MKEKEVKKEAEKVLAADRFVWWYPKTMFTRAGLPYRQDIFEVFDLIAARPGGKVEFIQLTTKPNLAARRKKIMQFFFNIGFGIPNCFVWAYDTKKKYFVYERITAP